MSVCKIIIILLFSFLSSCGLRPLHKNTSEYNELLKQISLESIKSIEGVELYNQFLDIIPKNTGPTKYSLNCSIEVVKDYNIIQLNTDILRHRITIIVKFQLKDTTTEQILLDDKFSQFTSYTTALLPYNNYELERNTINSLALTAAEEMKIRIIHLLKRTN
ncbi:MAG: hypothetical protein H6909_05235 [Rickettsiaceae bacterium]|nr:hypothetical protein [Rickettsiaceae bacterium]